MIFEPESCFACVQFKFSLITDFVIWCWMIHSGKKLKIHTYKSLNSTTRKRAVLTHITGAFCSQPCCLKTTKNHKIVHDSITEKASLLCCRWGLAALSRFGLARQNDHKKTVTHNAIYTLSVPVFLTSGFTRNLTFVHTFVQFFSLSKYLINFRHFWYIVRLLIW